MYVLCSSFWGVVSVELHAHSDPCFPPVHAGQHGSTRSVMESPFLREGLDRTFGTCKVLFLSSLSPARKEKIDVYFRCGVNIEAIEHVSEDCEEPEQACKHLLTPEVMMTTSRSLMTSA